MGGGGGCSEQRIDSLNQSDGPTGGIVDAMPHSNANEIPFGLRRCTRRPR